MINVQRKILINILVLITSIGLSACSTVNNLKSTLNDRGAKNYSKNQSVKNLEIPPDLTTPEFDKAFELPKGVISAVSLNNGGSGSLPSQSATSISSAATSSDTSSSNVGAVRVGDLSSIKNIGGKSVLQVNDTYPRSLVLTEIMLTRMGFKTISKSSAGNVITTNYTGKDVATTDAKKGAGFFSNFKNIVTFGKERRKLYSSQALVNGISYRVTINSEQGSPIVRFARTDGREISNAAHAKIITLLNTTFNS